MTLEALAREAGVAVEWRNYANEPHVVAPDALRTVLDALGYPCGNDDEIADSRHRLVVPEGLDGLPPLVTTVTGRATRLPLDEDVPRRARLLLETGVARDLTPRETHNGIELPPISEPGYHRLLIGERELVLAVAPERAVAIADLASPGARLWGVAAQVYGLRRDGDGGIGDAGGVAALGETVAHRGGDALALSPVHALFPAQPQRYGPYSPSSRLFLNPLHAAPSLVFGAEAVARAIDQAGVAQDFARLEALPLIDWPAATAAKLRLLRALFVTFLSGKDDTDTQRADLSRFEAEGGDLLADHACFEALQEEQLAADPKRGDWRDWPSDLRDPRSPAIAAFAQAHQRDVLFHVFLQWLTDRSLAAAQHQAKAAGMRIGLIADLAVGMDPAAAMPGAGNRTYSARWRSARRRICSTRTASNGESRISRRARLSPPALRRSSPRCAPRCAMPAACGSTMRWG